MGGLPPQDAQPCGLHLRRALHANGSPSPVEIPDGDIDPPLLPRPTTSAAVSGDPSPTAQVPPVPRVVSAWNVVVVLGFDYKTNCLEF
jgi:hypothetical protein